MKPIKSYVIDVKPLRKRVSIPTEITGFDITVCYKYPNGKITHVIYHNVTNPFVDENIFFGSYEDGYPYHVVFTGVAITYDHYDEIVIREPDPLEITMDDIEAKFGQEVKIVNE